MSEREEPDYGDVHPNLSARDEADLAAMHAPEGQTAVVELEGPAFYWAQDGEPEAQRAVLLLALEQGITALLGAGGISTTLRVQTVAKEIELEGVPGSAEAHVVDGFGFRVSMDLPPGTLPGA